MLHDLDTSIIREAVLNLIDAENEGNSEKAEQYLSKKFIAYTRSSGKEENRDNLLLAIEKGNLQDYSKLRRLDKEHVEVIYDGKIAVSRSLIIRKEKEQDYKIYRNIHVFENEHGKWSCKIWQVTELKNLNEIVD